MHVDMEYDGQVLKWIGAGDFKATSGLPGYQLPDNSCLKDKGPTPEGIYKVLVANGGKATDDGTGQCSLLPGWGLQAIPRGAAAGPCEPFWANWGNNRARLEPADARTRHGCLPERSGFYLHDSTKGYIHGCIEVEPRFFPLLRTRARLVPRGYFLLRVRYVQGRPTNGGTRV
jgi:hypothetical protein